MTRFLWRASLLAALFAWAFGAFVLYTNSN
jgi:hypothetical protein